MTPRVSFNALAQTELEDAAEYYRRIDPDVANSFAEGVENALGFIAGYPEGSPNVGGSVRKKQILGFPYCLLYEVHTDGIRVLAVMNQWRRPFYWLGRG